MSNYSILRIKKIHNAGQVAAAASHIFRDKKTINADPERRSENVHFGYDSAESLQVAFNIALPEKIRKNAVICVEHLITFSPEALSRKDFNEKQYFKDAVNWLHEKYGKGFIGATIHYDETTPHMHAYVVPLVNNKLSATHFFDGRKKMKDFQTDFQHKVGAKHGLDRGIEGSKAKHTSIQKYYAHVNASVADMPKIPAIPKKLDPPSIWERIPFTGANKARKRAEEEYEKKRLERAAAIQKVFPGAMKALMQYKAKAVDHHLQYERAKRAATLENEKKKLEKTVDTLKAMTREEAKTIAAIVKKTFSRKELYERFGIEEIKGKADIFEALVKRGDAKSFIEAVSIVTEKFDVKPGSVSDCEVKADKATVVKAEQVIKNESNKTATAKKIAYKTR